MQTFFYGLLLAGVSGVTAVAFKHPGGYARLFPYLFGIATIAFCGITIWHIAIEMSWRGLDEYIIQEQLSDAKTSHARLIVPYTWAVFWYLGVVALFYVNLKLPPFLQTADVNEAGAGEEETR